MTRAIPSRPRTRARLGEAAVTLVGRSLSGLRFRGKGRLGLVLGRLAALVSPQARCFPGGIPVRVDLRDRIQRLMWVGAYEPETQAVYRSLLAAGSVAVDVGAHIGYLSALAGALVGRSGAVHAFEPDPDCFASLASNAAALPQVVPWNAAVKDGSGPATLFRSPRQGESGWASLYPGHEQAPEIVVAAVALDEWAASEAVGRVDLVKIDAEGAELRILAGAGGLLAEHRPAILVEENQTCLAREGRTAKDLARTLRDHGYEIWRVHSPGGRPTGNLLAMHPERHGFPPRISRVRLVPDPGAGRSRPAPAGRRNGLGPCAG